MNAHPRSGHLVTTSTVGETVHAFVPCPLPPDPPLALSPEDQERAELATHTLGRLDGLGALLPDLGLFVYSYVRKEAVLSSQIEGTQSSLSDLLTHESQGAPGVPLDDVIEVSSYVRAVTHGLQRLRSGFPLSIRLVREIHAELLAHGRGAHLQPGELRHSQNWIGGTRPGNAAFVPPPPAEVMNSLGAWEKFLHGDPVRLPALQRAALGHVQFETIHPFLDGNGRLGRMLIPLILCDAGILSEPLLYISLYFRAHREEYYARLQAVREEGDWEGWYRFFLEGVIATAGSAVETARRVMVLFAHDQTKIAGLGRPAGSAHRVHVAMQQRPVCTAATLVERTGLSLPAVNRTLDALITLGLVRELTGRQRDRIYAYTEYLAILSEGT